MSKKYIDTDVIKEFYEPYSNRGLKIPVDVILANIDDMPAADVQEVKHGGWENVNGDGSLYKCSICGEYSCCKSNYCNECGSKMDIAIEQLNGFEVGQYIIYTNGDNYELGRIVSLHPDGAFVCYNEGETAAKTSYSVMHRLVNNYCIVKTTIGSDRFDKKDNIL